MGSDGQGKVRNRGKDKAQAKNREQNRDGKICWIQPDQPKLREKHRRTKAQRLRAVQQEVPAKPSQKYI